MEASYYNKVKPDADRLTTHRSNRNTEKIQNTLRSQTETWPINHLSIEHKNPNRLFHHKPKHDRLTTHSSNKKPSESSITNWNPTDRSPVDRTEKTPIDSSITNWNLTVWHWQIDHPWTEQINSRWLDSSITKPKPDRFTNHPTNKKPSGNIDHKLIPDRLTTCQSNRRTQSTLRSPIHRLIQHQEEEKVKCTIHQLFNPTQLKIKSDQNSVKPQVNSTNTLAATRHTHTTTQARTTPSPANQHNSDTHITQPPRSSYSNHSKPPHTHKQSKASEPRCPQERNQ